MRYRWDPAYPMGRRDTQLHDTDLRASDTERNAVADKLSRHYAEGPARRDRVQDAPRHRHVGHHPGRPQRAVLRPAPPARPNRRHHHPATAGSCPWRLRSWRSSPSPPPPRCRGTLLPRPLAADRRRRLLHVAPGGRRPPAPATARRRPPQLGPGLLSRVRTESPTPRQAHTSWTTRPRPSVASSSSRGLPDAELDQLTLLCVPRPPNQGGSRPRTCRWTAGASWSAATPWSSGTPPDRPAGRRGLLVRALPPQRLPLAHQRGGALPRHHALPRTGRPSSPSPKTTRSWRVDWWPGRPARRTAWPAPSSMPWSTWSSGNGPPTPRTTPGRHDPLRPSIGPM